MLVLADEMTSDMNPVGFADTGDAAKSAGFADSSDGNSGVERTLHPRLMAGIPPG
jgi:hypothetical protein